MAKEKRTSSIDMTSGSPYRLIISFTLPMLLGNIFQQLYNMVDSIVVGNVIGDQALAAVGTGFPIIYMLSSLFMGIGTGATVMISQYYGARDLEKVDHTINTIYMALLVGVVPLTLIGVFLSEPLLRLMQVPDDGTLEMAKTYMIIIFIGVIGNLGFNINAGILQGFGDSRTSLLFLMIATVMNIVLDLAFTIPIPMGVAGVAWATLIAQGVSAVAAFVLFARELRAYDAPSAVCFDVRELKNMARVALPSVFQQSTVSIGMMLVQSVVNSFGAETLAGYSAAMRIESICTVPMAAVGNAMSSYTAQNIGAGEYSRVRRGYRACYGILAAFALVIFAALQCFSQQLIALFLNAESSRLALETGTSCIRFLGWFYILIGLKMATDGVLRGTGDMGAFTAANLVNLTLRVVLAAVLAPRLGIRMVWYAVPVGWAANYLISFLRYRTGRWRERGAGLLA